MEFDSNINDSGRIYVEIPRESTYVDAGENYYKDNTDEEKKPFQRFGSREYHVLTGELDRKGEAELIYKSAFGMPDDGGCEYVVALTRQR